MDEMGYYDGDLEDWVVVTRHPVQHILGGGYGAKVKRPYPGARIWSTEIEYTYLIVTWVPTAMGPVPASNVTIHWEDES